MCMQALVGTQLKSAGIRCPARLGFRTQPWAPSPYGFGPVAWAADNGRLKPGDGMATLCRCICSREVPETGMAPGVPSLDEVVEEPLFVACRWFL